MPPLPQGTSIPLWEGCPFTTRSALILIFTVLLTALFIILCVRKARKGRSAPIMAAPMKAEPPPIEAANMQGLGERSEQQDAFRISPLSDYASKGLLCTLCDGMGGMAQGAQIAQRTVAEISSRFPMSEDEHLSLVPGLISSLSGEIYASYRGQGGSTLVLAYIYEDRLRFWCVGDSDLFLFRNGRLYAMNRRHEYRAELLERAISEDTIAVASAFEDPQADALSSYIGCLSPACDHTEEPFPLQSGDALLLCSDGVSDTLSLAEIAQCMALPQSDCCAAFEEIIEKKRNFAQDNYSAITIRFNYKHGGKEYGNEG